LLRINLEQAKTPWWIRLGIPLAVWQMPPEERTLYLTFDDGPTPGVTDRVLDVLSEHGAQATFFCLGEQATRYPELVQRILAAGHSIGNHGNRHLNGWQTSTLHYLADVFESAQILHAQAGFRTELFRPPFGRLRWDAMLQLSGSYRIVMWDSLSMDYRGDISSAQVTQNVVSSAGCGSIVLWHDSELAAPRMLECLPRVLRHFSAEGFKFARIADGRTRQSVRLPN
jgi:peptidoglycan-N-acetylglucosamine deacetylase